MSAGPSPRPRDDPSVLAAPRFRLQPSTLAAPLLLYLVLGLALSYPTLGWPMVYDDIHLVRSYSAREVAAAFHGHWDPDGIETPGLRPLTLVFNDIRYALFGENVVAHRVFLALLFAAYLTLLVRLAVELGTPRGAALAAGVLVLVARYSVYSYVWLIDGVHFLQGLAFEGALFFVLAGLRPLSWSRLGVATMIFAAGVLVREDTLAALPALMLLGFLRARTSGAGRAIRACVAFSATSCVLGLALLAYRTWALPVAIRPGADFTAFLTGVRHGFSLLGLDGFDLPSRIAVSVSALLPFVLLGGLAVFHARLRWRLPLVWLVCAVLACAPNLTVRRDDLLFFPVTFMSLFLTSALWELSRLGHAAKAVTVAVWLSIVLGGAHVSTVFAESFHPMSARALWWTARFVYGPLADRATIPPERLRAARRRLASVGIRSEAQLLRMRELVSRALAEGRRRPGPPEVVFFPLLPEEDF